jgi:hypothetical protein
MAAHEQHEQGVVLIGDPSFRCVLRRRQSLPISAGSVAPPLVDQPPRGGLEEPAARLLRNPVSRPALGRRDQRLLDGVLGGVEVAVPANESAEDLRRQLAQQILDTGLRGQRLPPAVWR